jgi:hypothetical protein
MKGEFAEISLRKSLPLSAVLIQTLVGNIAEQAFPGGLGDVDFEWWPNGVRNLPPHPDLARSRPNRFPPLYSVGRDLWVCYSFSEEKAHRIAYYVSHQCRHLIVVFVNPTLTRHHRCHYPDTEVISLFAFANRLDAFNRMEYAAQIRFLQNHLNPVERVDPDRLLEELGRPASESVLIRKSDLMESMGVMRIIPNTAAELFHYLAAMNLINAWLNQKKHTPNADDKPFKEMYFFKTHLGAALSSLISRQVAFVKIHVKAELVILELEGFQFSFRNVPKDAIVDAFENSQANCEIIWSGRKLQPVAPLVLAYARELLTRSRCNVRT